MSSTDKDTRAWYLIYTKPRLETLAQENLQRQGYETYLPLLKYKRRKSGRYMTVIEAMFSRYLFINLNTTSDNWSPIRSTIGVANLVRFNGLPTAVPDQLIESIKSMENEQGLHELQDKEFEPGDTVCIIDGVFAGLKGIFQAKTGDTVCIIDGVFAGLKGIFQAKTSQERVSVLLNIAGQFTRVSMNKNELLYA